MATERLCALADLPVGETRVFVIDGARLVAARSGDTVFVVEDRCSHDDGELGAGTLHGLEIECPRHGARFDLRDGRATRMPAVAPIATFATHVVDGDVLVDMPEY